AGAEVTRVPLARARGVRGRGWVTGFDAGEQSLDCDVVAVAAIPAPASEGARQQGCQVVLDPARGGFTIVVDADGRTSVPNVYACGDVTGFRGPIAAAETGARVGAWCARELADGR
ncbi:MAG: FAD-dependent oxidoreductase, partial [Proteobacteria bacterium]|nr:FAD-dependent oxidoreductase [Pseudomonadota bacterium]